MENNQELKNSGKNMRKLSIAKDRDERSTAIPLEIINPYITLLLS
jgi:hypothetical protein